MYTPAQGNEDYEKLKCLATCKCRGKHLYFARFILNNLFFKKIFVIVFFHFLNRNNFDKLRIKMLFKEEVIIINGTCQIGLLIEQLNVLEGKVSSHKNYLE